MWSGSSLRWDSGLSLIVEIEVAGSSPVLCGVVVQLVRIPACHAGGRGFESRPFRHYVEIVTF